MILRALNTFKNWALSGSARWELVPGRPSQDAAYVRALVLRPEDVKAAADLLMRMHAEQYPQDEIRGLQPTWFHSTIDPKLMDPTEIEFDISDLSNLSPAEMKSLKASAFGAILEFGRETPATVYWGNDLSKKRVEAAYELLKKRGRLRMQFRRLIWVAFIVTFVLAATITTTASLWLTFTTNVWWLFLPALFVGIVGIVEASLRLKKVSRTHLPHRLLPERAKRDN